MNSKLSQNTQQNQPTSINDDAANIACTTTPSEKSQEIKVYVTVKYPTTTVTKEMPKSLHPISKALCRGGANQLFDWL